MKKHAFEGYATGFSMQGPVQLEVTVFVVTCNRMPLAREVHTNLVGTPRFDGHGQQ